jgi:phosphoribosyl 1,2-cyclic phosphodiesterase
MTEAQPAAPFRVRFWGVRGGLPTPCRQNTGTGGNTTCVQVISNKDEIIILDGGSGIHALGREIMLRPQAPRHIHLFLTHFHWDHIQGMPFFEPLYVPRFDITLYSAHTPDVLQAVLTGQMLPPYFPVPWDVLSSQIEYRQISAAPVQCAGLEISSFPLHHPQDSVGFKIEHPRRKVVFATDHEHGDAALDRGLVNAARDADLLIHDAQFTPEEYRQSKVGWGHSTWKNATDAAREAGVRELALCHHDPDRHDAAVRDIVAQARGEFSNTVAAAEGLEL